MQKVSRDRSLANIAQELRRLLQRPTGAKHQTSETERRLEPAFLRMEFKLHATDSALDYSTLKYGMVLQYWMVLLAPLPGLDGMFAAK